MVLLTQKWTLMQERYSELPKFKSNIQIPMISIYMGLISEIATFGINGQSYRTAFCR